VVVDNFMVEDETDVSRRLTVREIECLEGLARGLTNLGISKLLHIAVPTVAMHLGNARKKLQAVTREQAVAKAVSRGLIKP
jgi:DNA-binding CsgD family transcriptional regulator